MLKIESADASQLAEVRANSQGPYVETGREGATGVP